MLQSNNINNRKLKNIYVIFEDMRLVIFDIDGTLCYSESADDLCFIQAYRKAAGIEVKNTDWDSYEHATEYSITCKIITKELEDRADPELLELVKKNYLNELMTSFRSVPGSFIAVPGAIKLIDNLRNDPNSRLGIATGGFYSSAKYKLDELGFNTTGIPILSSEEFGTKPEMIRELIRRESQEHSFELITYTGDRPYDLETCRELGINFIGVDYENNGKLKNLGAEKIINDYEPIEKFLELN